MSDIEETPKASNNVPPFVERLFTEKAELDERIEKLSAFLAKPEFEKLSILDKHLLNQQFYVMIEYSKILSLRLEAYHAHIFANTREQSD